MLPGFLARVLLCNVAPERNVIIYGYAKISVLPRVSGRIVAFLVAVPVAALLLDLVRLQPAPSRDPRHLMSGFRSGALLGTSLFVLLAQALSHRTAPAAPDTVLSFLGLGFMAALLIDRSWLLFGLQRSPGGTSVLTAIIRSAAGVTIGAVSHTSLTATALVAVTLLLQESPPESPSAGATRGLAQHPAARATVAALTLAAFLTTTALTSISTGILSIILALAAGAGVYVSASMLIPESHHRHSQPPSLSMTVASSMIIFGLVQLT
jgi:zinc transporter ZupT